MKLNELGLLLAVAIASQIRHGEAFGFRGFRFEGLAEPEVARLARTPSVGWITQPVDHFNPQDNRTWSMVNR